MDALSTLGIRREESPEKGFSRTLFYFIREFKINPLDEEYEIDGKKIIKRGLSIPLFNSLVEEMNEHYKRDEEANKKASRKR